VPRQLRSCAAPRMGKGKNGPNRRRLMMMNLSGKCRRVLSVIVP
jgi:hypothetical protein